MAEEMVAGVEYRDIPGLEGRYKVSENGHIYSMHKLAHRKLRLNDSGYNIFMCRVNDKLTNFRVGRCLLMAFVGPQPPNCEACHNNGCRQDDRVGNLRWDTRKANASDRKLHGTEAMGEKNGHTVLTNEQVTRIKERLAAGERIAVVRKDYTDVTKTTFSRIKRLITWQHVARHLNDQLGGRKPQSIGGKTLSQISRETGVHVRTIRYRIKMGLALV